MSQTTRTAWLNRAGHGAEHVEAYVRRGVITVGWARIPGLEDLRGLDAEAIERTIAAAGTRKFPGQDAGELLAFRDGMRPGDVAVTPDPKRKAVLFGEITGDYAFDPDAVVGDHRHVRTVRWLGRWPRYDLEPPLRKTLDDYQRTVLELPNQEDWLALAEHVRAGAGTPIKSRSAARQHGMTPRGPRAPRAPRAARPPTAPKLKAIPPRTCTVCQLHRAPTMFDGDSDVCRDCA